MNNNFDFECDKYSSFVSLQYLGEQFGIDYDTLVDRLERGSSLYMALRVPNNLNMEVREYPKRGPHYTLSQRVFRGSEKDLEKWLHK